MADPAAGDVTPSDDKGPTIIGVCAACIGVALLFVIARVWVRLAYIKRLGWDDHSMVAAAVVMLAQLILIVIQVGYGAGRHVQFISEEDNIIGLHINFVTQPLCLIGLALTKVSVGMLLLRFTMSKNLRRFIWFMIVFTIAAFIGNFLTVFFQCRPLPFIWDRETPGGRCIPPSHLKFAAFFNSSVSVLTDLIFALLPILLLWRVQLNRKTKYAVVLILSLGIFATVAGIVKMFFLDDYGKYGDFLYDSSEITIWTTVEICVAMVAACVPTLKPLFQSFFSDNSTAGGGSGSSRSDRSSRLKSLAARTFPSRKRRSDYYHDMDGVEMYGTDHNDQVEERDGRGPRGFGMGLGGTLHSVSSTGAIGRGRSRMDSEESILPHGGVEGGDTNTAKPATDATKSHSEAGLSGIVKTTDVSVSVAER